MWAQLLTGNITNKNKSKQMSAFSVSATNPPIFPHEIKDEV